MCSTLTSSTCHHHADDHRTTDVCIQWRQSLSFISVQGKTHLFISLPLFLCSHTSLSFCQSLHYITFTCIKTLLTSHLSVIFWLAHHKIAYLWGSLTLFLSPCFTQTVESCCIICLKKHISHIKSEVVWDMTCMCKNQEHFIYLIEMTHWIQDCLLYNKEDITAEKELIMTDWEIWCIILMHLSFNMKDVAAVSEKIAMLKIMILIFKDAEEFYCHSYIKLININSEYSYLHWQLNVQQLMQQVKQMWMTKIFTLLLLLLSPDKNKRSADITADIENVIWSIKQNAWTLQQIKKRWVEFQMKYSNVLFRNLKARKKTRWDNRDESEWVWQQRTWAWDK